MSEIVLTRIDNRLVHGQIFMQWCGQTGADMIVVANDDAASSHFKQGLMDMAVPPAIETRYWSIRETIARFAKMDQDYHILLVVKTPEDTLMLMQGGVAIHQINIGNLQMAEGKVQKTPSVAVDEMDIQALQKLKELGAQMEIRRLPQTEPEDLNSIFQ